MADRYLVVGDNHGDTDSLRHVLEDAADEAFDYAVHVGDFTTGMRDSRDRAADQLRAVEPALERFDERARERLVWVYGNQDHFGDLDHDLSVGVEVPEEGTVTVGGQRFASDPAAVEADVVLVTHVETWRLLDSFRGRAHFCGNTHRGRHLDRRLNSALLSIDHPDHGRVHGGYFLVDVADDGLDVELRSIGSLERVDCPTHRERGVQFQPDYRGCMYCEDDRVLVREMAATAFYRVAEDPESDAVERATLVEEAAGLWSDPPSGFREAFRSYLGRVDDDRYAPLTRTPDGRLALAEKSYAY